MFNIFTDLNISRLIGLLYIDGLNIISHPFTGYGITFAFLHSQCITLHQQTKCQTWWNTHNVLSKMKEGYNKNWQQINAQLQWSKNKNFRIIECSIQYLDKGNDSLVILDFDDKFTVPTVDSRTKSKTH